MFDGAIAQYLPADEYALAGLAILAAYGFLRVVLRTTEKNTDRIVGSNAAVQSEIAALGERMAAADRDLITLMAERDERLMGQLQRYHQEQMAEITKILQSVARLDREHSYHENRRTRRAPARGDDPGGA